MRRRGKVDRSHPEIVAALRGVGASVLSLAGLGDDAPDLLVGWRRENYLMEVKSDPWDRPTEGQLTWHTLWQGRPVAVVRTVDQALDVIGVSKERG